MNVDDSGESSSCAVRSKYFTSNSAKDESLSEFQEVRKIRVGPKTAAKSNSKPRKALKRPRGQKDIRTALQSKKNELESYSKDFDKVCKQAGIDVDSEQLQLAIALSKSLQNTESTSNKSAESSQTTTTKERITKIRTTLLEYGFKVPVLKIAGNTRKNRKHRKNYKLIQTSEVEKKEIIANRYTQVLFQNITHCSLYCSDVELTNIPLYYLASNVSYDVLRLPDTFYVNNLIEVSTSFGSLLKDWSKIPGRPVSPKLFEPMSINFGEMECLQEELQTILSGSLKSCKDIVSRKMQDWLNSDKSKLVMIDNISAVNINEKEVNENNHEYRLTDNDDVELVVEAISSVNKYRSYSPDMFDDDDVSDIFDDSKKLPMQKENILDVHKTNTTLEVMDLTENITCKQINDMDLTECVRFEVKSKDQCAIADQTTNLSQKTNITRRKSNDLMELTECVATLSQPIQYNIDLTQCPDITEESNGETVTTTDYIDKVKPIKTKPSESNNIDLTKSPKNYNDDINGRNTPEETDPNKDVASLDLTQSSNTSDELPYVSFAITKENFSDDTIIVDINDYANTINRKNSQAEVEEVHIDLTQNMQRCDQPIVGSQSFFEDYNHDHSDPKENDSSIITNHENRNKVDLTKSPERCYKKKYSSRKLEDSLEESESNTLSQTKYCKNSCSQNMFEDVPVELQPTHSPIKNHSKLNFTLSPNVHNNDNSIDDIDLTQKSDTSEELTQTPINDRLTNSTVHKNNLDEALMNIINLTQENDIQTVKNSQRCSSLGKKDNVSIDYDNLINTEAKDELTYSEHTNSESINYENSDKNAENFSESKSILSNCSQNSEVFEISDKELDYSLQKSRLEVPTGNFAIGGISILEELSCFKTSKKSIDIGNNSMANEDGIESFPAIDIKNRYNSNKCNEISPIKHRRITEIATPQNACISNMFTVVTPKNSEMTIKTNNITPMKDYESMSMPDIHKELDKYGIKPFKRKRAIQLLTHIYNQTHPIIENADELASPPKRRKPNDDLPTSSKKIISPRKILTSPRKPLYDIEDKHENILDIDEGKKNEVDKNKVETTRKGKGKGKGKSSVNNVKKDTPEKEDGDSMENMQSKSNNVVKNEGPVSKEIECRVEDWVFQKREKAKVHSCRVPLHIAFYNYVASRRDVREAILCYEPVEIDLIHKDLVGHGHRYDPKDLLKFLDKKCITVKTTDNDARNHKK